ncbi:MAG: hypothetical protein JWQ97_1665, partial [Phenylobacterium sp.]|nr:hypothetical protein [Phenylobacterium sp.]
MRESSISWSVAPPERESIVLLVAMCSRSMPWL